LVRFWTPQELDRPARFLSLATEAAVGGFLQWIAHPLSIAEAAALQSMLALPTGSFNRNYSVEQ
jgi:hypothetical protein